MRGRWADVLRASCPVLLVVTVVAAGLGVLLPCVVGLVVVWYVRGLSTRCRVCAGSSRIG